MKLSEMRNDILGVPQLIGLQDPSLVQGPNPQLPDAFCYFTATEKYFYQYSNFIFL